MKRNARSVLFLFALVVSAGLEGRTEAPPWLLALQNAAVPKYPPETDAVVLFSEVRSVVNDKGEIRTEHRVAYKILAPGGMDLAWVRLGYDGETKISDLKAWNLKAGGIVHEVTNKEAVESQMSSFALFQDNKTMLLMIPQVEVGSVIGYEFQQRHRPYILQDVHYFQQRHPVLKSRFVLELPADWEFRYHITNHSEIEPQAIGPGKTGGVWEIENLPAIPVEEGMPPLSALSPRLSLAYFPPQRDGRARPFDSWDEVAGWTTELMTPRAQSSGPVAAHAQQLADKRAAAEFVQRQIRYVAIEIGIGGYQPHSSLETFQNRYGDCKDKVTLLKSLLQPLGVEVYPVLIHNAGYGLTPEFASPLYFNHMIAAIAVAEGEEAGLAVLDHPTLGRLVLFDPTDERTPFGQLPVSIQGTRALLVNGGTGSVIETPVTPGVYNRLLRTGRFQLLASGAARGEMTEIHSGAEANRERQWLLDKGHEQWLNESESFLARWLPGVGLEKFGVGGLEGSGGVNETYQFQAPAFAQQAGDLLLFRPVVLGSRVLSLPVRQDRRYPLQFPYLSVRSDVFEVALPPGYAVEELPEPVQLDLPYVSYRSAVTQEGGSVKLTRTLEIKQLTVPAEAVAAVRELYGVVDRDERSVVLLKRQSATATP